MNEAELREIEERAAKAMPSPWVQEETWPGGRAHGYDLGDTIVRWGEGGCDFIQAPTSADAAFIAAARQDVPRLCAAVRELMAERVRLRQTLLEHVASVAGVGCLHCGAAEHVSHGEACPIHAELSRDAP